MTAPTQSRQPLLLYEPRTEGHHLGWLRFIIEDLLSAGYELSVAADLRSQSRPTVQEQLGNLLEQVKLLSAYDSAGRRHRDGKASSVAWCLEASGAQRVFLCAFDEIASSCLRRAAFGWSPPPILRARLGGIYHRPRFLIAPRWSPDRVLKRAGLRRLFVGGWLGQLLFLDEYLTSDLQREFTEAPVYFLPDPCPTGYNFDQSTARKSLQLPTDRKIFLFYGTGARRKGLQLAVDAMLELPPEDPAFLFCAGRQNPRGRAADGLAELINQGRARMIDRYVSLEEEKMSFAACDAVLLPYINHFGTSGVLSRAMSAGKLVIVSDEQLLGRLTRERDLGLVFESGNVAQLRQRIREATALSPDQLARKRAAAVAYARKYSRDAYRAALLGALEGR
jgi:glycosyltransferase involved in cell wall biosynthesis